MEKAKEYPRTGVKIVQLFLGLVVIVCVGVVIIYSMNILKLLPIYYEIQAMKDWDIPLEAEIIDFEIDGFYPLQKCFPICVYTGTIYIASSLTLNDLASFYGNLYAEHGYGIGVYRIEVLKSENVHNDGRPIYTVSLVRTDL